MRIGCYFVIILLLAAATLCPPVEAQQSSGSISGVVQDSQGAVIPAAKVTLINQDEGAINRELTTTTEGTFFITPRDSRNLYRICGGSGLQTLRRKGHQTVRAGSHRVAPDRP